jgi:pimeloyl-ACP methyl ester carboxylesterase
MRAVIFFFALCLSLVGIARVAQSDAGVFAAIDGSRIYYEAVGPESARSTEAPTLVFIHCWSCNRYYWKDQVTEFSKHYRVLRMDLPGHGDSRPAGKRAAKTVPLMARDVAQLLKFLDVKKAILIGSSMGGPIALDVMPLARKRVIGIIGVDNLHNVENPYPKKMFIQITKQLRANYKKTVADFIPNLMPENADPKIVAWIADQATHSCEPKICIPLFRSFPTMNLKLMMKNARVPIRNINAAPFRPDSPKTNVAANRKYGDFEAIEMTGVGHFPMLEKPEEFNRNLQISIDEIVQAR